MLFDIVKKKYEFIIFLDNFIVPSLLSKHVTHTFHLYRITYICLLYIYIYYTVLIFWREF